MAHPFTSAPTAFTVTPLDGYDDRRWWGGCAWDSFGTTAALHLDVRVDTACPQCGAPISFQPARRLRLPEGSPSAFRGPAQEWWDDMVSTCTIPHVL
ncbi:hypothetical protein ETD83_31025 [Actinomadura soli]|uniref:Uncharacterized protein n=1 Tax=Actinomadura soli TaxID=2508997 RepID=A0A5C4J3L0_9ACTN|nr:hypothetical protein ETD83_31025 [Actinomadura soli]